MSILRKPATINQRSSMVMVPSFLGFRLVWSDLVDGRFTITYKIFDPGGSERNCVASKEEEMLVFPGTEEMEMELVLTQGNFCDFLGFFSFNFYDFGCTYYKSPMKLESVGSSSSFADEMAIVIRYLDMVFLRSNSSFDCAAITISNMLVCLHWIWDMLCVYCLDYIGYRVNTIILIKLWIFNITRLYGIIDILSNPGTFYTDMTPCLTMYLLDIGVVLMISIRYNYSLDHIICHPVIINFTVYLSVGSLRHELPMDFLGIDRAIYSAVLWSNYVGSLLACWTCWFFHDHMLSCYTELAAVQKLYLVSLSLVRLIHDPGGAHYIWSYNGLSSTVLVLFLCFDLFPYLLVLVVILFELFNWACFSLPQLGSLASQVRLSLQESSSVLPLASLPTSAACLGYRVALFVASLSRVAIFRVAPIFIVGCLPAIPPWFLDCGWILVVLVKSVYVFLSGLVGD